MARRPARTEIYELHKKMHYLMNHGVPLSVIGETEPLTINRLKNLSGIPQDSLDKAMHAGSDIDGINPGDEKLGRDHQAKLAGLFKFETGLPHNKLGWLEWHDPFAAGDPDRLARRDTAARFIDRYRKELGPPERDTSEQLAEGAPRDPTSAIEGLASVELVSGQIGERQANVGIVISCDQIHLESVKEEFSIRKAILILDCGDARARRAAVFAYANRDIKIDASEQQVKISWNAGTMQRLRWRLEATGTSLGTFELDQGRFALIEQLSHEDVVTASLGTWLKHINSSKGGDHGGTKNEPIAFVDSAGNEISMPSEQLSIEQKRVMEHLHKRRLNTDENNFAIVAEHKLEFVRRR